jgi:hypothetical protein
MSATGGFDLASIPERIQSEVQARDPAQHEGRRSSPLVNPRTSRLVVCNYAA